MVRSALRTAEQSWALRISERLEPGATARLLNLLVAESDDEDPNATHPESVLGLIKSASGQCEPGFDEVEIEKLEAVRAVGLPADLIANGRRLGSPPALVPPQFSTRPRHITGATRRAGRPIHRGGGASTSIAVMAYRKRARGATVGAVALFARIDPEMGEVADTVSRTVGVSKAEFVEELLRELKENGLDERGVPIWWDRPIPSAQELNLEAS